MESRCGRRWAGVALAIGMALVPAAAGAREDPEHSPPTGKITIVKQASPRRYQDFRFTVEGDFGSATPKSFRLDDDDISPLPSTQVFSGLNPGVYTITEVAVEGWNLVSLDCGRSSAAERVGSGVRVTITAHTKTVSCTFYNEKEKPRTVDVAPPAQPSPTPSAGQPPGQGTNVRGESTPTHPTRPPGGAHPPRKARVLPKTGLSGLLPAGIALLVGGALLLVAGRRWIRGRHRA